MVLRAQIQNKGEPQNEESQFFSGRPGAGNSGSAGPLSRPHGPHRLPQSLPHRHPHLHLPAAERPGALREHRQADPLLQDRQGGRGRLPAPPPGRAGLLHSAQRLVQELPGPQAPGLRPRRRAAARTAGRRCGRPPAKRKKRAAGGSAENSLPIHHRERSKVCHP